MQDYEKNENQEYGEIDAVRELVEGVYDLLSGFEGYDLEEGALSVLGSDDGEIAIMGVDDKAYIMTGLSAGEMVAKAARVLDGLEESPMSLGTAKSCIMEHTARKREVDPVFEAALALCEGREAHADGIEHPFTVSAAEGSEEASDDAEPEAEEGEEDGSEEDYVDVPEAAEEAAEVEDIETEGLAWASDPAPVADEAPAEEVEGEPEREDPIGRLIRGRLNGLRKGGE